MSVYPRDLIGYGQNPPQANWPNKSKVAIQFVLNYEEGGENCVLHGDSHSETFLSDIVGAQAFPERHLSMESLYEYGSRAGFWRLHRLFEKHQIPITVFAVTEALERNPDALAAMLQSKWEIASHAMRWISYQSMSEKQENALIQASIDLHQQLTGQKPAGWYTGRTSPNTLKLVAQRDDILYCADSYADDLPYYDLNYDKPLLMVPYTLEANDMRFVTPQGFNTADHFFHYLKDAFDVLYEEGKVSPKMLSIGLHCRIIGRPGKIAGLIKFIEYIKQFEDIWLCTRQQIAEHWVNQHPLPKQ